MRRTKVQEAIDKVKADIEAQQRLLDALESINAAQTRVKRVPKERSKKRGGGEAATTVSGNYQP